MRALVTGASGFVGCHLVRHLLECGDEVVATYFPETPGSYVLSLCCPKGVADSKLSWKPLDTSNLEACADLLKSAAPEVIYHLAGMSFVPEAERDFLGALSSNVVGLDNILRISHQLQKSIRVVFVSSADVYGAVGAASLPVREETPTHPVNAYSVSKLMAEIVADRWTRLGNLEVMVMRPFNHIGPGQNVRFMAASFARQLALIAKGKEAPLIQVGNLSARKDFTDVRDVVRAYRLAAQKGHGRYVISSGRSLAVQDILDGLISISGLSVKVECDPSRMRSVEASELYGSYEKAEKELGWKPMLSLTQTLSDIYADALERCET
jgi:GDP-4-dehydro-6-deoxy-D-mannose reductase